LKAINVIIAVIQKVLEILEEVKKFIGKVTVYLDGVCK